MAHSDQAPSFSTPNPAPQGSPFRPPSRWQGQSYAAAVAGPGMQPPLQAYNNAGYHGHDVLGREAPAGPEYQFSLRTMPPPVQTPQQIPIDPALLVQQPQQEPFVHHRHRTERDYDSHHHSKKQDSRPKSNKRKRGKGKGRAEADTRGGKRSGRGGIPNYSPLDKELLFAALEEVLPTGEKGWRTVEEVYNATLDTVLQKNTLNIIYTQKALNLLSLTVSITGIRAASWGSIGYTEQPD
ncbi:hypothetical protein FB45DRAFT_879056 [Roridomyces roridus]|uniref:Myb-like domain-containing protein n=1 Tax=Roridomyces roridus TaxID=1738132 RepID=A0AAD7AZR1_9AGAR|nr:hypothetical protein FB45DRAFT_879056 [Roridomyces roridus]